MFEIVWGRFRDIYFLQTKEKLTWNAKTIKFLFAPFYFKTAKLHHTSCLEGVWKKIKKKFGSIQTNSITVWTDPNYVGSPNPNKLYGRRCSSSTILPSIFNACNKIKQKFWHLHQKQDVCLRYLSVPISDFLKSTGMLNSPPPLPHKGIDHSQNWQGSSLQLSMFLAPQVL